MTGRTPAETVLGPEGANSAQPTELGTGTLVVHVFVPSAVLGIGTGASAPVLPLSALGHGASVAVAGLVLALGGLGMVLGDLPAGRLVSVLGERRSVLLGTGLGVVGALLCLFSWSVASLAAGILDVGLA